MTKDVKNEKSDTSEQLNSFLSRVEKRAFVMANIATGNEQEALDIVQDALFKLVDKYASRPAKEWPALFRRILQSRIHDWHRRQAVQSRWRRWLRFGSNDSQLDADDALENHSLDQDRLPDDIVAGAEFSETLIQALHHLPPRQQQAFLLRAWEECSTKETAVIMNCSAGSVKTHYSRALDTLRKQLAGNQEINRAKTR